MDQQFDTHFNMCLIQYYPTGHFDIKLHSDGNNVIDTVCIISLCASRDFMFEHKNGDVIRTNINNGDLMIMEGKNIQTDWLHGVPADPDITNPRISISFRTFNLSKFEKKDY